MDRFAKIECFYNSFREISRLFHSSANPQEVLDVVVWKAAEAVDAKGAVLRLVNEATQELELVAAYGLSQAYLAKGPVYNKNTRHDLDHVNRIILIEEMATDTRIQYPREAEREGVRMLVDVPLLFREQLAGRLRIFFEQARPFADDEKDFLESVAQLCACSIEKARLMEAQKFKYDLLALHTEKLSALGRMAAGIAHEINNPLAGILLFSSNLFKKVPDEGPLKEGLGIIMRETQRCKFIIQELLEFARDQEPHKVPANISTIIQQSLNILENEFRLRHIRIEKDFAADLGDCCVDANQLEQVFVNLLLNAAQAIDDKGEITIRSRMDRARREIVVDVIDTGCGIPDELLGRIFEPFFSTKKNGSGLGLAVSFGIIQNHQGRLEASSQPGQGSQFRVVLPVIQKSPSSESHDCGTRQHSDH
jgi:signal transduction histidine kinase